MTTTRTLKILAALVWYMGGVILILKGVNLLIEAEALKLEQSWTLVAIVIGTLIGGLKAKYLFSQICEKNLNRIELLSHPKIWQFFKPGFFLFLALMIVTGATLSRLAHHNHGLLISVAILDLSIATALLGSSYVFWKEKAFVKA